MKSRLSPILLTARIGDRIRLLPAELPNTGQVPPGAVQQVHLILDMLANLTAMPSRCSASVVEPGIFLIVGHRTRKNHFITINLLPRSRNGTSHGPLKDLARSPAVLPHKNRTFDGACPAWPRK